MSCDVRISGCLGADLGRQRSHHLMDASCWKLVSISRVPQEKHHMPDYTNLLQNTSWIKKGWLAIWCVTWCQSDAQLDAKPFSRYWLRLGWSQAHSENQLSQKRFLEGYLWFPEGFASRRLLVCKNNTLSLFWVSINLRSECRNPTSRTAILGPTPQLERLHETNKRKIYKIQEEERWAWLFFTHQTLLTPECVTLVPWDTFKAVPCPQKMNSSRLSNVRRSCGSGVSFIRGERAWAIAI